MADGSNTSVKDALCGRLDEDPKKEWNEGGSFIPVSKILKHVQVQVLLTKNAKTRNKELNLRNWKTKTGTEN